MHKCTQISFWCPSIVSSVIRHGRSVTFEKRIVIDTITDFLLSTSEDSAVRYVINFCIIAIIDVRNLYFYIGNDKNKLAFVNIFCIQNTRSCGRFLCICLLADQDCAHSEILFKVRVHAGSHSQPPSM